MILGSNEQLRHLTHSVTLHESLDFYDLPFFHLGDANRYSTLSL